MLVYGPLEKATFELLAADPVTVLGQGRFYYHSVSNILKWYTGSVWKTAVDTDSTQTLTNKNLDDSTIAVVDTSDPTKKILFNAGGTTGTSTTLTAAQTADRVVTYPNATTTLLGHDATQVVTNKDIDGGTASNTSRITLPKETTTNLDALTRKEGTIVYDTTTDQVKYDDGSTLIALATSSGFDSSQSIATAAGTTTLTNTSPILTIFTGSTTQTVKLPDTSTCTVGQTFKIHSVSTGGIGAVLVQTSTAVNFTSVGQNQCVEFQVVSTASNAITAWKVIGNNKEITSATNAGNSVTANTTVDITSLTLPTGVWDVHGFGGITKSGGGTLTHTWNYVGINLSSNARDGLYETINDFTVSGDRQQLYSTIRRVTITAATQTVYLTLFTNFSGTTANKSGTIIAQRVT